MLTDALDTLQRRTMPAITIVLIQKVGSGVVRDLAIKAVKPLVTLTHAYFS
jgi:hypothetical protein